MLRSVVQGMPRERGYLKIGSFIPAGPGRPAVINRGSTEQGYVFKDEQIYFEHPDQVCYIPEDTDMDDSEDVGYSHNDFLDICNGQEDFAHELFLSVDWLSPETLAADCFRNDEWAFCKTCGKLYRMEGIPNTPCPICGSLPES